MVVVILVVHMKGRSEEMVNVEKNDFVNVSIIANFDEA